MTFAASSSVFETTGNEPGAAQSPPFRLFTTEEVAAILQVCPQTVRNERARGKLGSVMIGNQYRHSHQHITEYLKRQEIKSCSVTSPSSDKSENTGSAKSQAERAHATHGAAPGMIPENDKHAASVLARQTFRKQPTVLPNG